jgi:hypothetical protein
MTRPSRTASGTLLTALALVLGSATVGLAAQGAAPAPTSRLAQAAEPPLVPAPRAACGPGSVPEKGMQGRVAAADVAAGAVASGYRCNVEVLGQHGPSGGFKVERYVDETGRQCAYYDTTLLFPTNAGNLSEGPTGVAVLDMTDPRKPLQTATLATPAMQTPHESHVGNHRPGLLVAVAGNPVFAPGQVDVYDLSADCRTPVLRSSLPVGVLGHESGFSPDGLTFWAASLGGGLLTAVDLTNPSAPRTVYTGRHDTHALQISDDGNRAYLAAGAGFPRNEAGLPAEVNGLIVLDVSEVQSRRPVPQVREVGRTTWSSVTIPQAAIPVTIGGKPYLVEMDEFSTDDRGAIAGNGPRVGAARIIDISDETRPRVVSNIRLEVNQPANRPALADDPGASSTTGGYAGHYCNVPQRVEPGIVACSFLASGLRVFDIRDPRAPKEVAYFVAPVPPGGDANSAFSSPSFVRERDEVWYSDGGTGFYALKLTNGAWPRMVAAAAPPAARPAAPPAARPSAAPAAAEPQAAVRRLPATGLALPVGAGLLLVVVALGLRRYPRRV